MINGLEMKRLYTFFILILILTAVSCEEFLEIRPEGTLPTTGIDYSKSENVFLSVSASYAKLRNYGAHVFPYIGAFEIASDNADKGSSPEDNPTMLELDNLTGFRRGLQNPRRMPRMQLASLIML